MSSRRSRKHKSVAGAKPWIRKAALVLLIFTIAGLVAGYAGLRVYLHGERFRNFLSGKVSQAAGVKGQFSPFAWQGLAMDTDGFNASGEARLKEIKATGLHTEVSLGGVRRGVWEIRSTVMDRLDISLDLREKDPVPAEVKEDAPEVKRAKKSPWLPNEVEFSDVDLRRVTVSAMSSKGLAVASGMRIKAEKSGSKGAYKADISGGEIRLPWRRVPALNLQSARLRYQEETVFLSKAELQGEDGGRIRVDGEWNMKEKTFGVDGHVDDLRCENVLTGDWAKRMSGDLSSDFNVQGEKELIAASGTMEVRNGTLTALPVLDALAAYADTRRFRVLNLTEAHTRWYWKNGELTLTDLVLASEGLIRMEGTLSVKNGRLDGRFRLGLAPGVLSSIPGAEEDVFQPGDRSLLWTRLRITGTTEDPEEDLTARLVAAAGTRMFELLPGSGERALKFSQTILGDSPRKTLEKGEKILKEGSDTVREVSDLLEDLLGK